MVAGAAASYASPVIARLGGLVGKKSSAVDVDEALSAGSDLLGYITLANDLGMQAADQVVAMYPEEKVAEVRKPGARYNELSAKRKDGKIDAEQTKVAEDASAKLAALDREDAWKGHEKEKSANVKMANGKLGLMLLADGVAGTLVKPTTDNPQAAVKQIEQAGRAPLRGQRSGLASGGVAPNRRQPAAGFVPALLPVPGRFFPW